MKQEKKHPHPSPLGDIPATLTGYRIEIASEGEGERLLVVGVRRILRAEEDAVLLTAGRRTVSFFGKRLSCLALEGGILEIKGEVLSLSFDEGKKK